MSIKSYYQQLKTAYHIPWSHQGRFLDRQLERCPYCVSRQIIKHGRRRSKYETVQLCLCKFSKYGFFSLKLRSKQNYKLRFQCDGTRT